jgi:hypothetical protein
MPTNIPEPAVLDSATIAIAREPRVRANPIYIFIRNSQDEGHIDLLSDVIALFPRHTLNHFSSWYTNQQAKDK